MTDDRIQLTTEQIMLIRQGAQRLHQEFDGTFNIETSSVRLESAPSRPCCSCASTTPDARRWERAGCRPAGDQVDVFSGAPTRSRPQRRRGGSDVRGRIDIASKCRNPGPTRSPLRDVIVSMGCGDAARSSRQTLRDWDLPVRRGSRSTWCARSATTSASGRNADASLGLDVAQRQGSDEHASRHQRIRPHRPPGRASAARAA